MPPRYVCILDFEATCDSPVQVEPQEIIEFPGVLLDFRKGKYIVKSVFQRFVRPSMNPKLTGFCTDLTGIIQAQVDNGVTFQEALSDHAAWLKEMMGVEPNELSDNNFLLVTCGDWDIKRMLPIQASVSQVRIPDYLSTVCNIKILYGWFKGMKKQPAGMVAMLSDLGLPLEGRHHSGLDDCKNIANIFMGIAAQGCPLFPTGRLVIVGDGECKFEYLDIEESAEQYDRQNRLVTLVDSSDNGGPNSEGFEDEKVCGPENENNTDSFDDDYPE
jgi:ERI1 exoribonuclease 3